MKLWPLLLVLAGCSGCVSAPSMESLQSMTLSLALVSPRGAQVCSGTATGQAELTTAKHCTDGYTLKLVNGADVAVSGIRYMGRDVAVVTLAAPMFKHWAQRGPAPKQGDRIRYWGNPLGIPGVYREGAVVAVTDELIVVDLQVCHGDSGAGMFDDAGRMVGVVVAMIPEQNKCSFMAGQR